MVFFTGTGLLAHPHHTTPDILVCAVCTVLMSTGNVYTTCICPLLKWLGIVKVQPVAGAWYVWIFNGECVCFGWCRDKVRFDWLLQNYERRRCSLKHPTGIESSNSNLLHAGWGIMKYRRFLLYSLRGGGYRPYTVFLWRQMLSRFLLVIFLSRKDSLCRRVLSDLSI